MCGIRRQRVLVLNHFAVPRTGAGGTRHVELFNRLKNWDYELVAADRNLFDRRRYKKDSSIITVRTVGYKSNSLLRILNWLSYCAGALFRGLTTQKPDVVYASSPHLLTALAGWLVARTRGVAFVLEVRDLWPEVLASMGRMHRGSRLYRVLEGLERWLYRTADRIVVLAEGTREVIIGYGINPEKIAFLPNCSETDDFARPAPRAHLRKRFGFQGLVFVYAGAHGPANGLDVLLSAAGELQDALPKARIVLVGDGPSKPELVRHAQLNKLSNILFMDPVSKQEMPALLGAADVGLHVLADVPLFRYGVSPNKLFDYMAAGLPVITNCPGEVGGLVDEARAGVWTEPSQLATGILAMAEVSEAQRQAWGKAGREFIQEHRSRARIAQQLDDLLQDVLSDDPGRRWPPSPPRTPT